MKSLIVSGLLLFVAAHAYADPSRTWRITEIYDGDTFMVDVPTLPSPLNKLSIRVRGVDAPEIGKRARCPKEQRLAEKARDFTSAFLHSGPVQLGDMQWDKYGGRIDATVRVGARVLAAELIKAGLARPYNGAKRQLWC